MSEENKIEENKQEAAPVKEESKQEVKQETFKTNLAENIVLENQKSLILEAEKLRKAFEAERKEKEKLVALLKEREAQDNERAKSEFVGKALSEYNFAGEKAKNVAVEMLTNKVTFNAQTRKLQMGDVELNEETMKTGLESFFTENDFLLAKETRQSPLNNAAVKQQKGQVVQQFDMSTSEGINAYLLAKRKGLVK